MTNQTGSRHAVFGDRRSWTIGNVAKKRVEASPDKVFVCDAQGREETYGRFWEHSQRLAAMLTALGASKGSRIAILAPNGLPALHAWMAAALAACIDVSLNSAYRGEPLRHALAIAEPSILIVDAVLLPRVEEVASEIKSVEHIIVIGKTGAPAGDAWPGPIGWHDYDSIVNSDAVQADLAVAKYSDPATVIFTSGTTGPAKGVEMPHAQVCLLALQTIEQTRMTGDDCFYSIHPLFHIAGKFMGVFAIFAVGGRLALDDRFHAATWLNRVRETQATISIAHGPMIEMIHAEPEQYDDDQHNLSRLMCCPLPRFIAAEFPRRFGLEPIEMWGMTEVGCPCWTSLQSDHVAGSCGRVLTDWYDLIIIDPETDEPVPRGEVGEIAVRPRYPWTAMQRYLAMPEATLAAWRNQTFHTGDSAWQDDEGNVFFVDRLGDRIRRRAENISSFDIELAAVAHPAVRACAAIGVPSDFEGDDDILVVIALAEGQSFDPVEFVTFLLGKLPHYMVPRYIDVVDALPRTPTNKVRKKELRERGVPESVWDRKKAGVSLSALRPKCSSSQC